MTSSPDAVLAAYRACFDDTWLAQPDRHWQIRKTRLLFLLPGGEGQDEGESKTKLKELDVNARPHPGPFPRERANGRQPDGKSRAAEIFTRRTWLFPLPEGEGQGEGNSTL